MNYSKGSPEATTTGFQLMRERLLEKLDQNVLLICILELAFEKEFLTEVG